MADEIHRAAEELMIEMGLSGLDLKEASQALRGVLRPGAVSSPLPSLCPAEVEKGHAERVIRQLEHDVLTNAGMSQRCAVLSAEIASLRGISTALSRKMDLGRSLDEVLAAVLVAGGISTGALLLFEGSGTRVRCVGTREIWSDSMLESFFGDLEELRGRLETGATVTLPDDEGGFRLATRALESAKLGSALLSPLICQGELVGALLLTSPFAGIEGHERISFAVSASAQIAQGIALVRACAAQASAMRRAEESEATLRSTMESTTDGIVVADEDGGLLYWNSAAEAILPMLETEVSREDWPAHFGLLFPDRVTRFLVAELPLMRAIRGEHVAQVEAFIRREGGADGRWLSVTAQPFVRAGGQKRGGVAIFRDVTAEKAAREQLMVSDRMASVGMLAAGVAHEINNPLSSVLANLEMALRDADRISSETGASRRTKQLKECLDDAFTAAGRVKQIVRDLKIFSRAEEDDRGAVDIEQVLQSTLRMARNEIQHRALLVTNYGKVPPVNANESRLGQVFLNLIMNAAQAIPEGHADTNQIDVTTSTDSSGRVAVEIRDSGAGISPSALKSLFTPFFTTKPAGVGTGLGLAICRRIVTGLGGEITVDSKVGQGTCFKVFFPAALGRARESVAPPAIAPAARPGRVLLVDDDVMIGRLVRRVLSDEHEVEVLTSAREALALIAQGSRFDVILCDMMMPVVTGMDFHDELRKTTPEQVDRVVYLTGGAFTPRAREFLDHVSNARLEKPFRTDALRHVVNERIH